MNDRKIEQQADEAYYEFFKKWKAMDNGKHDAGGPTEKEVWHHAWRAALKSVKKSPNDS